MVVPSNLLSGFLLQVRYLIISSFAILSYGCIDNGRNKNDLEQANCRVNGTNYTLGVKYEQLHLPYKNTQINYDCESCPAAGQKYTAVRDTIINSRRALLSWRVENGYVESISCVQDVNDLDTLIFESSDTTFVVPVNSFGTKDTLRLHSKILDVLILKSYTFNNELVADWSIIDMRP